MSRNYTILVADDDMSNVQTILGYLRTAPDQYKILNAPNGEVAVQIAEKALPDLILMDWEMPVMDGLEATMRIKANEATKDIPIIMTTGHMTGGESLYDALSIGAMDYIQKPIEKFELIARVQSALRLMMSYNEIKLKNEQIAEQNTELMDSIHYARRIQYSILPDVKALQRAMTDAFVFYKPRDIVSGDFYWFYIKRKDIYVAAVDCTGHGVPGAFMSILGHNNLNQIIRDYGGVGVDLLLAELNERICATLKQGYGTIEGVPPMDGMDVALLHINLKDMKASYAGAKRPLYVYTGDEMQTYKGATYPIGGTSLFYEQALYQRHDFDLNPGDTIYLFSDGITDQFNSENRKKFGNNRLRQLLTSLQADTMETQAKVIETVIEEWRGETDQTDDILLMGLRV